MVKAQIVEAARDIIKRKENKFVFSTLATARPGVYLGSTFTLDWNVSS